MDELKVYKVKIYNYPSGKTYKKRIGAHSIQEAIKIANEIDVNGWVEWVRGTFKEIYVKGESEND